MLWLITVLCAVESCAAFKVIAPAGRLVAVRGQPIILGCEFTPDSYPDLSSLVVTWQRKEDARVVHSFYYNQDQLDRQSEDYWNRTALFITELKKGNASLRIEEVGPKDVGQYLCMVSNTKGTDKAQVRLEYGAFYTEPRLSISFTCSNVMVWYEAEGFPKPEVSWSDDQGQNLSHNTELTERLNETMGLYYLKSSYVAQSPKLNVTFTLKNPLLNQHMQRPVNLTYGDAGCGGPIIVIVLTVVCVLLLFIVIFLLVKLHKKKTGLFAANGYQVAYRLQDSQTETQENGGPS
ncbi:CD276 antigen-like [Astyanax mexicanus]|uniref:CD276 antigen-like n=1 Tax=Astyanax mexicanus TaxID=7994 RepID=A0A8T2M1N6_ASTMX|nr:CD276 antigen-like [Astyanax mexicanus]